MAHRTWCPGGPRRHTSRTTQSYGLGPGPAFRLRGLVRTCTAATRLSAAYQEQANARTDSARACSRRVTQASDNHSVTCEFQSIVWCVPGGGQDPRLRFVTVRLRQISPAASPTSQGQDQSRAGSSVREPGIMSSDEAAGDSEDLDHVSFMLMRAEDTFDGQDRVISRAAYKLHAAPQRTLRPAAIPGSCPTSTWPASAWKQRSQQRSCASPARGSASTAATASSTGKRSKYAWTRYARSGGGRAGPCLGTGTRSAGPGPDGHGDGRHSAVRGMRNPVSPHRARGPGRIPRPVGAVAHTVKDSIVRQREPGQWWLLSKGVAAYNGYGDPIDASRAGQIANASRPPYASPRSTRPGSTTIQDSARTATLRTATSTGTRPSPGCGYCPRGHGKSRDPHWSP